MERKKNIVTAEFLLNSIEDLKLPSIKSVSKESTCGEVLDLLQKHKFGATVIAEEGKCLGILSERDFLFKEFDNDALVTELMTPDPFTLNSQDTIAKAMELMSLQEFRHIPIVSEDGLVQHMISAKDIIRYIASQFKEVLDKFGTKVDLGDGLGDIYDESFNLDGLDGESLNGNLFLVRIRDVIPSGISKVDAEDSVKSVLEKMRQEKSAVAAIMEYQSKTLGIVTERDFLLKVFNKLDLEKTNICEIMTRNPHMLLSKNFVVYGINNMFQYGYRNVLVVDEDRIPLGLLTLLDILKYFSRYLSLK